MAADRIQIAQPAPPRCSGCFQAKPQEPHVDFGAAYDGPTVPALENTVGVVGHTIDDLILCATCVGEAAALLGLEDAAALRAELDQVRAANADLAQRLAGFEDYSKKLEAALQSKPEPQPRPRPKPQRAKAGAR